MLTATLRPLTRIIIPQCLVFVKMCMTPDALPQVRTRRTVAGRQLAELVQWCILSAYPKNVIYASLCVGISGIGMPLVRFFG